MRLTKLFTLGLAALFLTTLLFAGSVKADSGYPSADRIKSQGKVIGTYLVDPTTGEKAGQATGNAEADCGNTMRDIVGNAPYDRYVPRAIFWRVRQLDGRTETLSGGWKRTCSCKLGYYYAYKMHKERVFKLGAEAVKRSVIKKRVVEPARVEEELEWRFIR